MPSRNRGPFRLTGGFRALILAIMMGPDPAAAEVLPDEMVFWSSFETPGPDGELVVPIASSSDDVEERTDGSIDLTSSDLELGIQGSLENERVGLRFNNIDIQRLATIVSAHLQFTVDEVDSDTVLLQIEGEASPSPAPFSVAINDLTNRAGTVKKVSWMPPPWTNPGAAGPAQRSPDLAEIVNEIVDLPGWSAGGSLVLLIGGDDGKRVAESYDGLPSGAPVLHIAFNNPGSNRRPIVEAGADQLLEWPNDTLVLNGVIMDDGLPEGQPVLAEWAHVGGTGPGTPQFGDATSADTTVTFPPDVGSYRLRLTGDDGELSSSDELEVVVTSNTAAAGAGTVKLSMKVYKSTYDRLFDEDPDPLSPADEAEMAAMYHQLTVLSPSFDRHLDWFPDPANPGSSVWHDKNLFAVDEDDFAHPSWDPAWLLRDSSGNALYIDFGCNPTCPKFAADFGNEEYRTYWINEVSPIMDLDYDGLFVDDVGLHKIYTSDESGNTVLPVDPRSDPPGQTMTLGAWQTYMAEFTEQIKAAFPTKEMYHNAVFGARPADDVGPGEPTALDRQLMAADVINIEGGAPVIEGGLHSFGFESFLAFVDKWHARGKRFVLQDDKSVEDDDGLLPPINAQELQTLRYQLATYYLINLGEDSLAADGDAQQYRAHPSFFAPDAFSPDYQLDLGAALTGHYRWNGLFRRDFECGMVLVNQPEQPTITVSLGASFVDLDGQAVTSVTLPTVSGAVLTQSCPP